ncbi:hypothetical protein JXC34_04865 [Candidatus Woesearchaeota archaeon]|nr:hypothetical protein [Candidatus Woesearchaeota archaeon]
MIKKRTANQKSKMPVNARPENYFILITGVPLKNLKELGNALETMNGWVFSHHVNESRNDFSSWVQSVLNEEELAEEIKNLKNMKDMEMRIFKHLVNRYL